MTSSSLLSLAELSENLSINKDVLLPFPAKFTTEVGFEMINSPSSFSAGVAVAFFVVAGVGGRASGGGGLENRSRELGEAVFAAKGNSVRLSFDPDFDKEDREDWPEIDEVSL